MKILIVEDEEGLREALIRSLTGEGYLADGAADGDEGYQLICTGLYDLVLLDIMLPVYDGLEVLRRIRKQGIDVPVILLTARSTVEDKVGGMDLGADDYLTKPFAMPELSARIRMVVRRGAGSGTDHRLRACDLILDTQEYNNVDVYVSFLRKKMKFVQSASKISAVRGVGYELEAGA